MTAVKHLWWSFIARTANSYKPLIIFEKRLYRRCLTRFHIHLWKQDFFHQLSSNISSNFQIFNYQLYWIDICLFFRRIENVIVNASFLKPVCGFQFRETFPLSMFCSWYTITGTVGSTFGITQQWGKSSNWPLKIDQSDWGNLLAGGGGKIT